jgi:hypothetical protein
MYDDRVGMLAEPARSFRYRPYRVDEKRIK